jgi:hypothetical protein
MRILNLLVVTVLVLAAVYVYEIKFEATLQAEKVMKLRSEIRHERDGIAVLRADWAKLDNPTRIQTLTQRYLPLRQTEPTQIDTLDNLPERPPSIVPPGTADPIGAIIEQVEEQLLTGSIPSKEQR